MNQHSTKDELIERISLLTEEQVAVLLQVARLMQPTTEPEPYDEASDPTIGFISGPADLASRAKDILREEIDPHSGWTQKDQT